MKKVSDKELLKWIDILGVNTMLNLYIESKIRLTSKQIDMLIAIKNEGGKRGKTN